MSKALGFGQKPSIEGPPAKTPVAAAQETQLAPRPRPRTRLATQPADVTKEAAGLAPTPARRGRPRSRDVKVLPPDTHVGRSSPSEPVSILDGSPDLEHPTSRTSCDLPPGAALGPVSPLHFRDQRNLRKQTMDPLTLTALTSSFGDLLKKGKYQDLLKALDKTGVKEALDKFASTMRLGVGVSKDDSGHPEVRVTLESKNSPGVKLAEDIAKEQSGVRISTLGPARAQNPNVQVARRVDYLKHQEIAPGSSVSHAHGHAATLGVFTQEVGCGTQGRVGFVSSGSALSLWGRARRGDIILSPGPPDGVRTLKNAIGELGDFVYLVPANEEQSSLYNEADLGHVVLTRDGRFENVVPSPSDPDSSTITLSAVAEEEELFDYINRSVFKNGRTSGLTRGTLSVVAVSAFPILGGDGRKYLFTNCALVEAASADAPFSQPGDAGAVVYADNGIALGNVVGGNSQFTVIQPLSRGLKILGLRLFSG
jgi:hypothetical protein